MKKAIKSNKFNPDQINTAASKAAVLPLQSFFVTLMGLLLALTTLPQGSFFPKEKLQFSMLFLLLGVIVAILISLFRQRVIWDSLHGWSPLFLMVAYWIPVITFQWVVLWEALTMILYYVVALTVFLLVRNLNREGTFTQTFLNLMLLAGIVVAMTSLLGAAGVWKYADLVMGNRLAATFQYPNTLAAWMMTLYFIAAGLMLESTQQWKKMAYGSVGFFMLFVFVFTYSRAAWLLFPVVALAYLILIPGKNRMLMLFTYIISGFPLLLALLPFYRSTTGEDAGGLSVFGIILVATAVFAMLLLGLLRLSHRLENLLESQQHPNLKKRLFAALGAALLAAALFLVVAFQATEPLVFDNLDREDPLNQILSRSLSDIQPLTDYELHLQVETQGGSDEHWPWLVEVFSENAQGESTRFVQHVGEVGASGDVIIPFETLEDTAALRFLFRNQFESTAVTFHSATLFHQEAEISYSIQLQYRFLPEALVQRFESIDREEHSANARVAYYRDSIAILRNHPLGAGGGAWDALYREYQSQPYYSRQVHNFFLQTAVEAGLLGLMLLVGMVGLILWGLYNAFRHHQMIQISIHVAALSLIGHSFLDFNFSYFSTFILYWMLLALLQPPVWISEHREDLIRIKSKVINSEKLPALQRFFNTHFPGWVVALALIPALVMAMTAWGAARSQAAAALYGQVGENQLAYDALEQAASLDRLRPDYRLDLTSSLLEYYINSGDKAMLTVAEHHWINGMRYAPRHRDLLMAGVNLKIYQGDFQETRDLLQRRITEAPLDRTGYEDVSAAYLSLAKHMAGNANLEMSSMKPVMMEVAQEALQLLQLQKQANQEADVPLAVTGIFKNNLMHLRTWQEYAASRLSFELNPMESPVYTSFLDLEFAAGAEQAWRAWGREDARIETILTADGLVISNAGTDLGIAYTPNLELEPESTYQVWVDFADISLTNPLQIHVIATDSEERMVQHTHVLTPEEMDSQSVAFSFTTTNDIEMANDQYIRLEHPGSDIGSFTIRGIVVQQVNHE